MNADTPQRVTTVDARIHYPLQSHIQSENAMSPRELLYGLLTPVPADQIPVRDARSHLEHYGPATAIVGVILYVIGFVVYSLYYSSMQIRAIELVRPQYVLCGFYLVGFLFWYLVVPTRYVKRRGSFLLYLIVSACAVLWFDGPLMKFVQYLVERSLGMSSYWEFEGEVAPSGYLQMIMVLVFTIIPPVLLRIASRIRRFTSSWALPFFFLFALGTGTLLFTHFVFPGIPSVIGGGRPPVVALAFSEQAPRAIQDVFDISLSDPSYVGTRYYARLIYPGSCMGEGMVRLG